MMRKTLFVSLAVLMVLTSCSSTGEGAYVGGQFGYVIGSAIGGIAGGGRGHDWGSLIGTMGGAVAGAAVGNAAEKSRQQQYNERRMERTRADDRIDFAGEQQSPLEIRYAGIHESHHDGVLSRGEECQVRFEIMNHSDRTVYDVRPLVEDVTGNKHVKISPNLLIESIAPHQGVRYTATIVADKHLKDGEIRVMVGVAEGPSEVTSQTRMFTVPTAKTAR